MISSANTVGLSTARVALATRALTVTPGLARVIRGCGRRGDDALDDHHSPVDDDPEIHRAHRKQVGAHPPPAEIEERAEQRKRDGRTDDRGGPPIERERRKERGGPRPPPRGGFSRRSTASCLPTTCGRRTPPPGRELHAPGQRRVEHIDRGSQARQNLGRILSPAHQHDSFDRI